jgi:hypothetical protein
MRSPLLNSSSQSSRSSWRSPGQLMPSSMLPCDALELVAAEPAQTVANQARSRARWSLHSVRAFDLLPPAPRTHKMGRRSPDTVRASWA